MLKWLRRGSLRQNFLPISPHWREEKSSVNCVLTDAAWPREKEVSVGCGKTGKGNIIAWFMGILVRFI